MDPLEKLSSFYQSLDAIPTPPLAIKPPAPWKLWVLAVAPLGAVLASYGFICLCASGPNLSGVSPRVPSMLDRYAVEEMKALTSKQAKAHVLNRHRPLKLV